MPEDQLHAHRDKTKQHLHQAKEKMNHTAQLAFARLISMSECLQLCVLSFFNDNIATMTTVALEPIKTSRMMRHELSEFCALCHTVSQLEPAQAHV